jgi:serralysin
MTVLMGSVRTLDARAFHTGAAAHDLDDRIVYNSATGALTYDADGNRAGVVIQFAVLDNGLLATHPALTYADFMVV